ncbi:40S ribosomal protein S12-like isoform X1 [Canna indica]|uniref:40S ribosomal protein S12-like isoform X1 n=1 Tax=Canna indica TaxID=4628 RepID=A0AAQ3L848_9LILI|nr:40S ribosomal protein S12-like isoform X1 [Canna indica]
MKLMFVNSLNYYIILLENFLMVVNCIVLFTLCKIDSEGKARKVVGCSCVVVKDYGEESEGLHVVQEYVKSH